MKESGFDRRGLKLESISGRTSRVSGDMLWKPWDGETAASFLASLPDVLAARSLRRLAASILDAREKGACILVMYGGHVIKCGLGPLLCNWMRRGLVSALATNGSGSIHDLEMAIAGWTSEDVQAGLGDGSFGMWRETSVLYAKAVDRAEEGSLGLGESLGAVAAGEGGDGSVSPLVCSLGQGMPLTVHPALGTDIVHPAPMLDWGRLARAAERDFDTLGSRICGLGGGVVLNVGSAVVMPEVFLKLLSCARNLGSEVSGFTAADLDMIRQYRPSSNVVERPTAALGGTPVSLTGHHEIMLPLLDLALTALEEGK